MWFATTFGFFSVVQKPGTDHLTVRARVRADLDALRERYLPELSATVEGAGTDYRYRGTASHSAVAAALGRIAQDIDYSNFKNAVAAEQGVPRAKVYGTVWGDLVGLEKLDKRANAKPLPPWPAKVPARNAVAYGGVVFDPQGLVLLREPKGHYDNYHWTFPKGRPDLGETPEEAALRETLEETGVSARIVAAIPGEFAGRTTTNRYFLMEGEAGSGGVSSNDPETWAVRWVTPEEARDLIAKTVNVKGRARDLLVLEAALAARG